MGPCLSANKGMSLRLNGPTGACALRVKRAQELSDAQLRCQVLGWAGPSRQVQREISRVPFNARLAARPVLDPAPRAALRTPLGGGVPLSWRQRRGLQRSASTWAARAAGGAPSRQGLSDSLSGIHLCLGTDEEPEVALFLFVMMEVMLPEWEPSVHTGHLSGAPITGSQGAVHMCPTPRGFLCTPLSPVQPLLQHTCWVYDARCLCCIWPVPAPRREQSIHGAGHHQPHCLGLWVLRTALGGWCLCGPEAPQHPSQRPQARWLPCVGLTLSGEWWAGTWPSS